MGKIFKTVKEAFNQIEQLAKKSHAKEIKRILIIDDDHHIRKMLRKILERENYIVSEASNGEEGCLRFFKQPADLIITDLVMPGISGIETTVAIKEDHPDARFILMSGCDWYGIDAEFEIAKSLGAITLKKPIEREIIREAIRQLQNLK
jgi:two-component system response regulator (stage 0 sporulation protein F)